MKINSDINSIGRFLFGLFCTKGGDDNSTRVQSNNFDEMLDQIIKEKDQLLPYWMTQDEATQLGDYLARRVEVGDIEASQPLHIWISSLERLIARSREGYRFRLKLK